MAKERLELFLSKLFESSLVYSPVKKEQGVFVEQVNKFSEIDWSGELPRNNFNFVLLPKKEVLASIKNNKVKENFDFEKNAKNIVLGVNILDLQALTLLELVFEKDIYFQKRRQNTYVIGFSNGLPDDFRKYKAFHADYEDNFLEHVLFDVFIERKKNGKVFFFAGSEKGQLLLENNKIRDYENIEFTGIIPEQGMNAKINVNKQNVASSIDNVMWDELAEICLSCGKCSMACPTCFCFDQRDEAKLDSVDKVREKTSCFYPEFSETAGGRKDLDTVKKRLYFWYYHKFVRIPEELNYYGCVSCMRCTKVCPVGINIAKNLQILNKNNQK